ncbi:MAG: FAD-binding oxidoreductase [Candidatus Helarchaeales archaeon]
MQQQAQEKKTITKKLKEIVGESWVSDSPEELLLYSYDMTENKPSMPDYVVMPKTPEEIQKIVVLANQYKIPIVPFVAGANIGGLTIPLKGGIVLDLKRMDRIIKLDEDDMYIIIEPGVTFGHIHRFLKNTKFRYCYPMAPPTTSVMANALMEGLNNLSLKHGNMSEFINGIEVVLPNGKLIRIGTCMIWDEHWWGRGPFPDLLGLFTGWQGMTGIVTKIALQVWPRHPLRSWQVVISNNLAESYQMVRNLTHAEILDDILFMSIETIKMIYGVPYGEAVYLEGEPRWVQMMDFSANNEAEMKGKMQVINENFKKLKSVDPKAAMTSIDAMAKLYGAKIENVKNLPITLAGMLEYGGLTWVGTYMTTKKERVVEGVQKSFEIIKKHGFETCLYTRSMRGHHYFAFRYLLRFDKGKEGETERMQKLTEELFDAILEMGGVPYKTPVWAAKKILNKVGNDWYEFFKSVKDTIDPNGIMNPGRWELE